MGGRERGRDNQERDPAKKLCEKVKRRGELRGPPPERVGAGFMFPGSAQLDGSSTESPLRHSGGTIPTCFWVILIMAMQKKNTVRLPPEVNRVLYVRNLPYKISGDEMYDIFGKYGAIRQIRVGNTPETRGTAFVVYEDIFDAKSACDHLSGFNVCGRYLVVLYYQANKAFKRMDSDQKREDLEKVKAKFNLGGATEERK
ncbi:unnamed protein product [Notodromas monacha]|uniref:Splicing factor 3B subunit 6 n=1 Tax=Notodromas monacha TaxID=399045 RepID=A0A7R9BDY3_9CRUS|nr:unnamed protein product [Notodromas monacha]CAG0912674.1 unnamed protein product [Notodromas monacha]